MSTAPGAAVGLSMRVASLASSVSLYVAIFAVVVVMTLVVDSRSKYGALLGAVSFVGGDMVVSSLGDGTVAVTVVAIGADVLSAVITALTAVLFSFRLSALSCHFFFWLRLPCPGPGIAEWKN